MCYLNNELSTNLNERIVMGNIKVYDFTDYRSFLKEFYNQMKEINKNFSYQMFSDKAEIKSRGFLYNVIQGKRKLDQAHVLGLVSAMKFDKHETEYFEHLVSYNNANAMKEKAYFFEKLMAVKSKGNSAWEPQIVRNEQYDFYSQIHHSIIRSLIGIHKVSDDFQALAKSIFPKLTVGQIKKSVTLLEKLGFIRRKEFDDSYELIENHISTLPDVQSLAIKNYHKQSGELALTALSDLPVNERNISSVMVGISKNSYARLCTEIEIFRNKISKIAEEDNDPDTVYQVNIQLFPLTKTVTEGEK